MDFWNRKHKRGNEARYFPDDDDDAIVLQAGHLPVFDAAPLLEDNDMAATGAVSVVNVVTPAVGGTKGSTSTSTSTIRTTAMSTSSSTIGSPNSSHTYINNDSSRHILSSPTPTMSTTMMPTSTPTPTTPAPSSSRNIFQKARDTLESHKRSMHKTFHHTNSYHLPADDDSHDSFVLDQPSSQTLTGNGDHGAANTTPCSTNDNHSIGTDDHDHDERDDDSFKIDDSDDIFASDALLFSTSNQKNHRDSSSDDDGLMSVAHSVASSTVYTEPGFQLHFAENGEIQVSTLENFLRLSNEGDGDGDKELPMQNQDGRPVFAANNAADIPPPPLPSTLDHFLPSTTPVNQPINSLFIPDDITWSRAPAAPPVNINTVQPATNAVPSKREHKNDQSTGKATASEEISKDDHNNSKSSLRKSTSGRNGRRSRSSLLASPTNGNSNSNRSRRSEKGSSRRSGGNDGHKSTRRSEKKSSISTATTTATTTTANSSTKQQQQSSGAKQRMQSSKSLSISANNSPLSINKTLQMDGSEHITVTNTTVAAASSPDIASPPPPPPTSMSHSSEHCRSIPSDQPRTPRSSRPRMLRSTTTIPGTPDSNDDSSIRSRSTHQRRNFVYPNRGEQQQQLGPTSPSLVETPPHKSQSAHQRRSISIENTSGNVRTTRTQKGTAESDIHDYESNLRDPSIERTPTRSAHQRRTYSNERTNSSTTTKVRPRPQRQGSNDLINTRDPSIESTPSRSLHRRRTISIESVSGVAIGQTQTRSAHRRRTSTMSIERTGGGGSSGHARMSRTAERQNSAESNTRDPSIEPSYSAHQRRTFFIRRSSMELENNNSRDPSVERSSRSAHQGRTFSAESTSTPSNKNMKSSDRLSSTGSEPSWVDSATTSRSAHQRRSISMEVNGSSSHGLSSSSHPMQQELQKDEEAPAQSTTSRTLSVGGKIGDETTHATSSSNTAETKVGRRPIKASGGNTTRSRSRGRAGGRRSTAKSGENFSDTSKPSHPSLSRENSTDSLSQSSSTRVRKTLGRKSSVTNKRVSSGSNNNPHRQFEANETAFSTKASLNRKSSMSSSDDDNEQFSSTRHNLLDRKSIHGKSPSATTTAVSTTVAANAGATERRPRRATSGQPRRSISTDSMPRTPVILRKASATSRRSIMAAAAATASETPRGRSRKTLDAKKCASMHEPSSSMSSSGRRTISSAPTDTAATPRTSRHKMHSLSSTEGIAHHRIEDDGNKQRSNSHFRKGSFASPDGKQVGRQRSVMNLTSPTGQLGVTVNVDDNDAANLSTPIASGPRPFFRRAVSARVISGGSAPASLSGFRGQSREISKPVQSLAPHQESSESEQNPLSLPPVKQPSRKASIENLIRDIKNDRERDLLERKVEEEPTQETAEARTVNPLFHRMKSIRKFLDNTGER